MTAARMSDVYAAYSIYCSQRVGHWTQEESARMLGKATRAFRAANALAALA